MYPIFVLLCWIGVSTAFLTLPYESIFKTSLYSLKCDHSRNLTIDVSGTNVHFYDFPKNISEVFPINDAAQGILSIKTLNKTKKFIIFVNGFKTQIEQGIAGQIRNAYKNYPDSYLIILDHFPYTNSNGSYNDILLNYARSVKHVYYIGKALAQVLVKLSINGISPKNMHCIGHSLGAQMLGHTGEIFFNSTGEKIKRITALDPAGPCFSNNLNEEQVRSGVAEYVDVYHCDVGILGSSSILGDTDFIANSGNAQPNCNKGSIFGMVGAPMVAQCNHKFCVDIWAASVKNKDWFTARKYDKNSSSDNVTIAGQWNPGNATGVYFFLTYGYDLQ